MTETTDMTTEMSRLRELVGDESAGAGTWDGCSRAEAIRQADEFHAGQFRWMAEHDKRRAERDDALAEVERLRTVLGDLYDAVRAAHAMHGDGR